MNKCTYRQRPFEFCCHTIQYLFIVRTIIIVIIIEITCRCQEVYGEHVNIHEGHLCGGTLNGKSGTCVGKWKHWIFICIVHFMQFSFMHRERDSSISYIWLLFNSKSFRIQNTFIFFWPFLPFDDFNNYSFRRRFRWTVKLQIAQKWTMGPCRHHIVWFGLLWPRCLPSWCLYSDFLLY